MFNTIKNFIKEPDKIDKIRKYYKGETSEKDKLKTYKRAKKAAELSHKIANSKIFKKITGTTNTPPETDKEKRKRIYSTAKDLYKHTSNPGFVGLNRKLGTAGLAIKVPSIIYAGKKVINGVSSYMNKNPTLESQILESQWKYMKYNNISKKYQEK